MTVFGYTGGPQSDAAALQAVPKGTILKLHLSVWDGYQRSEVGRVDIEVR